MDEPSNRQGECTKNTTELFYNYSSRSGFILAKVNEIDQLKYGYFYSY